MGLGSREQTEGWMAAPYPERGEEECGYTQTHAN